MLTVVVVVWMCCMVSSTCLVVVVTTVEAALDENTCWCAISKSSSNGPCGSTHGAYCIRPCNEKLLGTGKNQFKMKHAAIEYPNTTPCSCIAVSQKKIPFTAKERPRACLKSNVHAGTQWNGQKVDWQPYLIRFMWVDNPLVCSSCALGIQSIIFSEPYVSTP